MKMTKKIMFAIMVLVCYNAYSQTVTLVDMQHDNDKGVKLQCVTYKSSIDCDYDSYNKELEAIARLNWMIIKMEASAQHWSNIARQNERLLNIMTENKEND